MRKFCSDPKVMMFLALSFAFFIVAFNIYDLTFDKTQEYVYTKDYISKLEIKKTNLNTATKEELVLLNGIGEKTAEKIIKHREEEGPFESIEELKNLKGITDESFNKLLPYITVK
ncbi:MAG: helix-hairpin-helix domain-containing protein [Ruminococcus sp.]|nr:helix-hairpin-helix domain-containing protein [Ruminococcus sp.]